MHRKKRSDSFKDAMDPFNTEYEDLFADEDGDNSMSHEAAINSNPASPFATKDLDQESDAAADKQIQQKLKEIASAVVKKRVSKPQPKLDSSRLTGERGLAALQKLLKKVKFRGKGHEVDDLNAMMQAVEHWAHRLYPKLSFDEIINKIEILGSKKAVQTYVNRMRFDLPIFEDKEVLSDDDRECEREIADELPQASFAATVDVDESPSDVSVIAHEFAATASFSAGGEFTVNNGGTTDSRAEPAVLLSDELRARIQKNREAALERRKASLLEAGGAPTSHAHDD